MSQKKIKTFSSSVNYYLENGTLLDMADSCVKELTKYTKAYYNFTEEIIIYHTLRRAFDYGKAFAIEHTPKYASSKEALLDRYEHG